MKLLLISPLPPPVGGIANWSVNLLNYYSKNKNNLEIIHQNSAIKFRNITNKNLIIRFLTGIRDTRIILSELKNSLKTLRPDVIHLTSSGSLALLKDFFLIRIAAKRNIPVIIHFHFGRIPALMKRNNWEWRLLRKVIKRSYKVIVIDQKSFQTLLSSGFMNVVNISNPISNKLEEKAISQNIFPDEFKKATVVFVGHVVQSKGIFELVKACSSIIEIKELLIIGPYENITKDELINLAKKRENGRWLRFLGTLDNNEVLSHLGCASLLALPSYTEGFPNVVIEAMAMSCPVVATDVGAIPEMLDINTENSCGICVKPKNVEELSTALFSLITDPENAKRMGRNGVKRVLSNYTFSSVSKLYEMVWNDTFTENVLKYS